MIRRIIRSSIAMILVLAMCIQLAPLEAIAASSRVIDTVESAYEPEVYDIFSGEGTLEANDDTILCELDEKREESVKHFRLSDGSIVAAVYDVQVHKKNSIGEWVDIDNTLTSMTNSKGEAIPSHTISMAIRARSRLAISRL